MNNVLTYRGGSARGGTALLLVASLGAGAIALDACSSSSLEHMSGTDAGGDATTGNTGDGSVQAEADSKSVQTDAGDGSMGTEASDARVQADATDALVDVDVLAAPDGQAGDVVTDSLSATDVADEGDASNDRTESGPCTGVLCRGACVAAADCRGCVGATLLCGPSRACVATCSNCGNTGDAALPVECYTCDRNHENPLGTCQPDDPSKYCLSGDYFGAYLDGGPGSACSCGDAGASECPGRTQVCAAEGQGSFCFACGEVSAVSLQGLSCKGGGSCNATNHACN